MAKSALQIEIEGLKELQKQMEDAVRELGGEGLLRTMRDTTLKVQAQAIKNAPFDTGRLAASITPKLMRLGPEVRGVVGSRVNYAAPQEFGWTTREGIISQGPRRGQPYKRTKVEGKFYLRRALKSNLAYIQRKFRATVVAIFERKRD